MWRNHRPHEAGIVTADLVHLARNDGTDISTKELVVYSGAANEKPLIVFVKK